MIKFIGLLLGYWIARIPGAIIGFLIGLVIDNMSAVTIRTSTGRRGEEDPFFVLGPNDFSRSLLMLSAAVMRADGKVMRSELDYAKAFFVRQFGEVYTRQLLVMLRDILKQQLPIPHICQQIRANMQYEVRLQLVHYLFGLASADEAISSEELTVIRQISSLLGVSHADMESLKAMFQVERDSDYKILEIEPNASDEDVKKAYRKMALKYHPDKLTQMGEEFQKAGKEKFQAVQEAYERIRKKRGFR